MIHKLSNRRLLKSKHWRIVIPNLTQYKDSSEAQLLQLKQLVLERLHRRPQDKRSSIKSQFQRGLRYYSIAVQKHLNGVPHLDILLIYDQSIQRQLVDYDYLYKHGNVTTYRHLNSAILDYHKKQDSSPLSNVPEETKAVQIVESDGSISTRRVNSLIQIQQLEKDPYLYLQRQMLKDPLHFNVEQYVRKNNLDPYIKSWSSIKSKLKDMQTAAANLKLKQKPGFRYIDRPLIESQLSPEQLKVFDSWSGYQTIVNYLNQIVTLGYKRPLKTMNLLITGPPSVGKTALFLDDLNHTYNCVQRYTSVYPMGTRTWWPNYRSSVYNLIVWNEAKLTSYSYDTILKVLQGSQVDLQYKGGSTLKIDNPLVIMLSNLSLEQMIKQKFGYSNQYVRMARANLAVRIENLKVPKGYNLFLLQKLLVPVFKS